MSDKCYIEVPLISIEEKESDWFYKSVQPIMMKWLKEDIPKDVEGEFSEYWEFDLGHNDYTFRIEWIPKT